MQVITTHHHTQLNKVLLTHNIMPLTPYNTTISAIKKDYFSFIDGNLRGLSMAQIEILQYADNLTCHREWKNYIQSHTVIYNNLATAKQQHQESKA